MVPHVTSSLPQLIHSGLLGRITPGSYFLMRFESRIVWMEIIETGFGYCNVVLKGLELQETSCHHVEAGKVDDIFSYANGVEDVKDEREINNPCCGNLLNRYYFHTLQPLGKLSVKTFSKSKVNMTGIIDHPDNLKLMTQTFLKCLIWVLKKYAPQPFPDRWKTSSLAYTEMELVEQCSFPDEWYYYLQEAQKKREKKKTHESDPLIALSIACYSIVEVFGM